MDVLVKIIHNDSELLNGEKCLLEKSNFPTLVVCLKAFDSTILKKEIDKGNERNILRQFNEIPNPTEIPNDVLKRTKYHFYNSPMAPELQESDFNLIL